MSLAQFPHRTLALRLAQCLSSLVLGNLALFLYGMTLSYIYHTALVMWDAGSGTDALLLVNAVFFAILVVSVVAIYAGLCCGYLWQRGWWPLCTWWRYRLRDLYY